MLTRCVRGRCRGQTGFTLIELMIVILVILILAAILVPQFGLAQERAKKAKCVNNQRNIETAVAMWASDNPSTPLAGGTMDGSTPHALPAGASDTAALTGGDQYATPTMFIEPDDTSVTSGVDYYLSNGSASGGASGAAPLNPSYGHVACAYDGIADPWVAGYDGTGQGGGGRIDHTRGASASP
jgi:prepilin-type N-terminal cleavage/methylation domain-containing protein